jgi:hypothetical protein
MITAVFPTANGELFGNLAWTWEDDRRLDWTEPSILFGPGTGIDFQEVEGINQTDVAFGYRNDSWSGSVYVENVFDELWYDGAADGGRPGNPYSQYDFGPARPQTIGLRLSYQF